MFRIVASPDFSYPDPPVEAYLGTQYVLAPNRPGVYFIYDKIGLLLYVGQTKRIKGRLSRYYTEGKLSKGHKVAWLEFPVADLIYAEAYYTGKLRPHLCKVGFCA